MKAENENSEMGITDYEGRAKRLYDLDPDLFFDDFCKRLKKINEDSAKRLNGGQE